MRRAALILWLAVGAGPAHADSNRPPAPWANRQLPDPAQEAAARKLMDELRCIVCQGQAISDSDAELAGDMRSLVRERIAAGETPGAVRAWLVDRYGDWISYRPAVTATSWPLYAGPLVALLGGLWLVRRRLRRGRRA